MLRGTIVKVNQKCSPKHLQGTKGIAVERVKSSGYIKVISRHKDWLIELCYPEDNLDIIEPPKEL